MLWPEGGGVLEQGSAVDRYIVEGMYLVAVEWRRFIWSVTPISAVRTP